MLETKLFLSTIVFILCSNACSPFLVHTLSRRSSSRHVGVTETERELQLSVVDVFKKCAPSVAFVTSTLIQTRQPSKRNNEVIDNPRGRTLGSGSGFLVTEDGYLLTNFHVIERAFEINKARVKVNDRINCLPSSIKSFLNRNTEARIFVRINSSTKFRIARVVDTLPLLDIAILKINATENDLFAAIPKGCSSNLEVGEPLAAIGNPFGLDQSLTTGVVSALDREISLDKNKKIKRCIQTDAAINPGNSGGPLLDSKGCWVGVNTAIISTSGSSSGIGFAVPVDDIVREVDILVDQDKVKNSSGKRVGRGVMGLNVSEIDGKVVVVSVQQKSPAEESGLSSLKLTDGQMVGDTIVAVNGNLVINTNDLIADLQTRKVGEKVFLTVQSLAGNRRVVYMTLGKMQPKI